MSLRLELYMNTVTESFKIQYEKFMNRLIICKMKIETDIISDIF